MKALWMQLKTQIRMDARERSVLMTFYIVPLIFFGVMGAVFASINPDSKRTLCASMSIFAVTMGAVLGIPAPIIKLREQGVLRAYRVNGIPGAAILLTHALSAAIHLSIVAAIISVGAPLLFGAGVPENLWAYVGILALTIVASIAVGLLIGVSAKNHAVSIMASQLVFLPSLLLGGLMFPASMLPGALRAAGEAFPATHAMNAFRALCFGQTADLAPALALLVIGGIALVCGAVTVALFRKTTRVL